MSSAIVLLSGGLDSATCAAIAGAEGHELLALSFRYGQRHASELAAARRVAEFLDVAEHKIVDIDLRQFGGSALTDDIDVPRDRDEGEMTAEIPVTYVPARNTIFLSYALAFAEVRSAEKIYIGVNAVDYSGYPDCRPQFIAAFEKTANLALAATVEGRLSISIETPIIDLSKAEIIRRGTKLGLDYSLTVSCYQADESGAACGRCDSCLLRRRGFADAGIDDPTRYQGAR
jgi:7-cyano-7-deazaguanine synthase